MSGSVRDVARLLLRGREDTRVRATWRVLLAFGVFFAVLLAGSALLRRLPVPVPDVLVNAPGALPAFVGVAAVLVVSTRLLGRSAVAAYGLDVDRRWWTDAAAGVVAGCLFQALVTALTVGLGAGRIVGTLSSGFATGPLTLVVALAAAAVGFLGVALWEELLFRAVVIHNALEGLTDRGLGRRRAAVGAVLASVLAFGPLHALVAADGISAAFAGVQAAVAGGYFALAYVLTDSLALPVGIHLSTNLWTTTVFGFPDSGFPALVRLQRDLGTGPEALAVVLVPAVALVGLIVAWVWLTRGTVSLGDSAGTTRGPVASEAD